MMIAMIAQGNRQGASPIVIAAGVLAGTIVLSVLVARGGGAETGEDEDEPPEPAAAEEAAEHTLEGQTIDTQAIDPDASYVLEHPEAAENLEMVLWMEENWQRFMLPRMDLQDEAARQDDRQKYHSCDGTYYAVPDCYTCHQGNRVPSAVYHRDELADLPDDGMTVLPTMLRGTDTDQEWSKSDA